MSQVKTVAIDAASTTSAGAGHRLAGAPELVALGQLSDARHLAVTARMLGGKLRTHGLGADAVLAAAAMQSGMTFVFHFGVAVTFAEEKRSLRGLDQALMLHVTDVADNPEIETAVLTIERGGEDRLGPEGSIVLSEASPERLVLLATVLARSVVLARDEVLVSQAFDQSAPVVADLRENGRARLPVREVMRLVGEVLAARHRVMGTVQASERPDLLWDHPELDRLYARLEAEYELKERADALHLKFDALGDFAEALLNIAQDKRSVRLEAAIIVLIAFEIVLNLFDRLMA